MTQYTYTVVQYVHDPTAREALNIGVVLFAPGIPDLRAEFIHTHERLSNAFADFDGDSYRRTVRRFEAAVLREAESLPRGLFAGIEMPTDVGTIAGRIWSNPDMSFRTGPVLAGISKDLDATLESLFERMVTSQYEVSRSERRTDAEVWSVYNRVFMRSAITPVLEEHTFHAPSFASNFDVKFEHSFKNGRWHALQPLSLDYADDRGIQAKVARWLGTTVMLEDNTELDKLYLLLGPPRTPAHQEAYHRAVEVLDKKLKVPHEIVEEDDAEQFAERLAGFMKEHGILRESV